jgi:hypothetical protein
MRLSICQPLLPTRAWICLLIMLLAMLLLVACPRQYPAGKDPALNAKASHPWELPGANAEQQSAQNQSAANSSGTQVVFPDQRGPRLPAEDTLDESQLAGAWRQVCFVRREQLQLSVRGAMNLMELQAGGTVAYHLYAAGKQDIREGTWRKVKPGVLDIRIGSPAEMLFYGQLVDGQFLYLWNYDSQEGLWFARQPDKYAAHLERNRFQTTRGDFKIANIVQDQYTGTVTEGEITIEVRGGFQEGVLTMDWRDAKNSSQGYAVFIVSPDSSSLLGYWWLDDWEAAPFGGAWDCTAY